MSKPSRKKAVKDFEEAGPLTVMPPLPASQVKNLEKRKQELHKVLNSLAYYDTPEVVEARQKAEEAEVAYEDFCATNEEYLEVRDAKEVASSRYYRLDRASDKKIRRKIDKLRNRLYLEGPTDEVIAAIKELADSLTPGERTVY